MKASERVLRYVRVHTTSDPGNPGVQPSTNCQWDLARMLEEEMREIGLADVQVSDCCYVYGKLPATPGCEAAPALGLIAHMDTAPDAAGEHVVPVIHGDYDGGDVVLPNGRIIDVATYPKLRELKGETLITASGDTLLGADNKAGIAEILTACETLIRKKLPHGPICVAFTPDEEIGTGADGFDVKGFGADFAYTVDGSEVGEIEYETFNAAFATLRFQGVAVHPGAAKDIMVNAVKLALEFQARLPGNEAPEHTAGREGYYHPVGIRGNVEAAELEYMLRDHDRERFEGRKRRIRDEVERMQARYGRDAVTLEMSDQYYNMSEVVEQHPHLIENARRAIREAGLTPITNPVRGGTDGARLSFMGLPCPNLGTGGFYCHGPSECITAERMDRAVAVLLNLIGIYANERK